MSLHPLPVELQLADVLSSLKNFQADPGEGAHAAWHAAGFAIGLFHKHPLMRSGLIPEAEALLADIEATAPHVEASGLQAIDWNQIKPWLKKVMEFLLLILG